MLLTTTQLAKELNVHAGTVRRMVYMNKIPYIKLGSETGRYEYRFDLDKVLDTLKSDWL